MPASESTLFSWCSVKIISQAKFFWLVCQLQMSSFTDEDFGRFICVIFCRPLFFILLLFIVLSCKILYSAKQAAGNMKSGKNQNRELEWRQQQQRRHFKLGKEWIKQNIREIFFPDIVCFESAVKWHNKHDALLLSCCQIANAGFMFCMSCLILLCSYIF